MPRRWRDGRQSRDFTYVADVVRALRCAGRARGVGGRTYNIGGGAPVSINDALEQLADASGRPLDVRRHARESGDVLHTAADVTRAREEIGFTPATTLADGLRAELDWVLERSPADLPLVS
jgi:nucleoside-diphosphate-sugar epimerase